nr:DUF6528 family protein [Streptomyces roseifaciens]
MWDPRNPRHTSGMRTGDAQNYFGNGPTDAKWAAGGRAVTVSASSGGVAVIEYPSKRVLFYALPGGNPHSVQMLPDGNLVVACSTGGDRLALYSTHRLDKLPETEEAMRTKLIDAHGVWWDSTRELLWAIGRTSSPYGAKNKEKDKAAREGKGRLVAYEYHGTDSQRPVLKQAADFTFALSDTYVPGWESDHYYESPHDLCPVAGEAKLVIATDLRVLEFDIDTAKFTSDRWKLTANFGPKTPPEFKGVSVNGKGTMVYAHVDHEGNSSYTSSARFLHPAAKRTDKSQSFYKFRWFEELPGWSSFADIDHLL